MRARDCWLMLGVALLLAGCSGDAVSTVEAEGTVKLADGSALPGGTITFSNADKSVSASAQIASDGTFKLGTNKPGDGAPVGSFKVLVQSPTDFNTGDVTYAVDQKFGDPATTPLSAEIKAGQKNKFEFQVEAVKKSPQGEQT